MEIRPARPDEYERLGVICERAYRALPGADIPETYAAELRNVQHRAEAAVVLVAVDDGELIGCVTYVPTADNPLSELLVDGECGIRMLAVDPDSWGQGAGRALVAACVDRAKADGRTRVVLSSTPEMTVAHRLYERLGFHRVPSLDWEPQAGVRLLAFALDLDDRCPRWDSNPH